MLPEGSEWSKGQSGRTNCLAQKNQMRTAPRNANAKPCARWIASRRAAVRRYATQLRADPDFPRALRSIRMLGSGSAAERLWRRV
jgi:hypothetical protein